MLHRTSLRALLALISLAISSVAPLALAQSSTPSSRITQAVDETERTTLAGTTPKAVMAAKDLGSIEGGRSFRRMVLVLTPSAEQQAALKRLIENQHNKNSSDYHKWLTPEQFAARFGPSDDDVTKVKAWLESQGLNPTEVGKGRQWIEFNGSAQQVDRAFRTSMHQFDLNGQTHIANSSDISIPAALTPVVSGVLSLNDFRKQPAHSKVTNVKRDGKGKLVPVDPNYTTTDGNGNYFYYVAPSDFQKIYNVSPLLKSDVDGAGISIAVVGRSDIYLADVQTFRQAFGLPQNDPNIVVNGPDPGTPSTNDMGESSLDVEWAGAAAPGATINLVESASTDTTDGIDLSSAYIVDHALSPIVSLSYGMCEALMGPTENQFYNALWQQAAAEGITVFVSTGDVGAAQCDGDLQRAGLEAQGPAKYGPTINGLSSTPFDVAVGGTQFHEANNYTAYWSVNNDATSESALGYIPEQAWNESCDPTLAKTGTNCVNSQSNYNIEGAGGGPSNCSKSTVDDQGNVTCIAGYSKPSWQTGVGVPEDGVRDTPDLSLNASPDDDGYLFCFIGSCQTATINGQTVLVASSVVGGTSVSTPSIAGIMALVEQKNGASQGQANYVFYRLAAKDNKSSCGSSTMTDPSQSSSCNFNDITMGSNSVPGLPGYGTSKAEWSAGAGYDMATGLGTVNAANLAANWDKVALAGSTTALTASGTTLNHGQPLTIAIAVKPASGGSSVPTGDVALVTDKYGDVAHVTLDATGKYAGAVSNLPGGTYNLAARYSGDGTFAASVSSPVSLTVASEGSETSFQLSALDRKTNKIVPYSGTEQYGDNLYFSVKVASKSGNGLPTGTINILNGSTVVLSESLNAAGTAYIGTGYGDTYTFPTGASKVSIQYLGDNSFSPSTSASTQVNVKKQQVYTGEGINGDNVPAGQPVYLVGNLFTPSSAPFAVQLFPTPPTGTMQFYDNGKPLSDPIAMVDNGGIATATYLATPTTTGTHTITVAYSGDSNYTAVSGTDPKYTSANQFTVVPSAGAATVTSIVQTPATVTYGQSFTYRVAVTPVKKGGPVPTGKVSIGGSGDIFGSANLVNGQGSVIEQAGAGITQVFAQYQGDSHYAASTSPIVTTTVKKITTPVSLTTPAPYVLSGQQTSLNFVAVGYTYGTGQSGYYTAQGTVQFFTAVNGGKSQAVTAPLYLGPVQPLSNSGLGVRVVLPTGTNVVTAQYSGDSYFNPASTAPVTIVVSSPDFTVNSNPPSLTILAGGSTTDALAVTPILGFSGPVSLSCASGLPAGTTCSFSPSAVAAGGGQSSLTIAMQGPFTQQSSNKRTEWAAVSEMCGLAGLFFVGCFNRRKRMWATILVVVATFGFLSGCGGNGSPSSTVVVLGSSQSKVASGTAVTLTAQVSGGNNSPSGTVTFYDGTTTLGNAVNLSDGKASLAASNLTVGTHSITAKYSGDSSHSGSTSQAFYEAVTGTTTLQIAATSGGLSHSLNISLAVQ